MFKTLKKVFSVIRGKKSCMYRIETALIYTEKQENGAFGKIYYFYVKAHTQAEARNIATKYLGPYAHKFGGVCAAVRLNSYPVLEAGSAVVYEPWENNLYN